MVIRTNSDEHKIVKKLRDHEKRLDDAEQERETDPTSQVIRQAAEQATASSDVEVTDTEDAYLVYDDSDSGWNRSVYQT